LIILSGCILLLLMRKKIFKKSERNGR